MLVGPRELERRGGGAIGADQVGLRPQSPRGSLSAGPELVEFHTSDTVMRLPELARSMIIIGGGYVAADLLTSSPHSNVGDRAEPLRGLAAEGGTPTWPTR